MRTTAGLVFFFTEHFVSSTFSVQWSNALLDYVDCFGKQRASGTVKDVMGYNLAPAPPYTSVTKQGPGRDIVVLLGEKQRAEDELKRSRLDFK